MQIEDEHHKEVYAYFGLAIYLAQCLENGIVNALSLSDLLPNRRHEFTDEKKWADTVDRFYDEHLELTMGKMIRALKNAMNLPTDLRENLAQCLKIRNTLVHSFFRDRIELMTTEQGRDRIIEELCSARDLFQTTDNQIEEEIEPMMQRYGINQELIDKHLAEMMSSIK